MTNQKTGHNGQSHNSTDREAEPMETSPKVSFSQKSAAKERGGGTSDSASTAWSQKTYEKHMELKKVFGKNLARIRREAGYSQLTLSVEVGLTHNFINELEQGTKGASFRSLSKFSVILRTPVHKFFEPLDGRPAVDKGFQYSDPIDTMVNQLHEMIDTWNDKRTK
jgi:transcriptional regulator with XRE-family HTH domain